MALAIAACADGKGAGNPDCMPAPECLGAASGDSFCHGWVQRTCEEDADGCMQLVENDCAKSNLQCDDSSGSASCVSCSDQACDGVTPGSQVCGGGNVMQCDADIDGCLIATMVNNCQDAGLVCSDVGTVPICRSDCDDAACVGKDEGDGICMGQVLQVCQRDQQGCMKQVQTDCAAIGGTCDASGEQPVCVGGCEHDPRCVGVAANSSRCDGYRILACTDTDANGCLELNEVTHCTENLCDPSMSPPVCETTAPSGNTCTDAIPIAESGLRVSATVVARFSDMQEFTGAGCVSNSGVPELMLSVDLREGDEILLVQDTSTGTESPVAFSVQTTCDATAACEASGQANSLSYIATATATYYIVVETTVPPGAANTITLDAYINPICGNGFLDPGEACDDGNEASGDGCSSLCAVEGGHTCTPITPSWCVMN